MNRVALVFGAFVAGMLALAASASATTETFNYTGAAQTWTVPAGVTSATFDLYGAQGGTYAIGAEPGVGGLGGRATATISVTPGDSIQVDVGGAGFSCCIAPWPQAAFNGGGAPEISGGGGASDIRIGGTALSDRKVVAGGGGGGNGVSTGGDGGGLSGLAATPGFALENAPGNGGTQSSGGEAGGTLGVGGTALTGGGGGGGGYYGGGGGLRAGGGGGSGYGPTGTTFGTGVRSGNGLVTVTYTEPMTIADLIDSVNALKIAKGTKNSLLQKLNGTQKNLNYGDTAGACDKLASFISQVKALRAKKIIPASAADQLIADTRAVRESIGC
jgi:hypothetical protein